MAERRARADIGALVITIEEEGRGLQELEELLTGQTKLLVEADARPLLDNLSNQERVLRRLGKLEEQRLRLLEELVAAGRLAAPPSRLRDLVQALGEPERAQVRELARLLGERARRIGRLQRRNRHLIESGRRCLEGFVRLLLAPDEPATYGPSRPLAAAPRFFSGAA